MSADHTGLRATLTERLADLDRRIAAREAELSVPLDRDPEEAAIEQEDDDSLAGERAVLLRELAEVVAAIGRIDRGEHGRCASCDAEIPAARLEALPEATLCVTCAAARERANAPR